MTLTQMQFTLALAAAKSFSKAADQCGVSQPSLSNSLAQLEEELGGRLFFRTSRKVGLTPLGEYLLPLIEATVRGASEVQQAARSFREPSHKLVRIGLSPLINMSLLTTVIEPFQHEHPDVEIVYKERCLEDSRLRLEAEKIDVIIAPREPRNHQRGACAFYDEPLYFLPRQSASQPTPSSLASVTLSEIAAGTFILTPPSCDLARSVRQLFKTHRYQLQEYRGQALSHQVMEDWVQLGIGNAILPASKISYLKPQAQLLWLQPNEPARLFYELSWNKASLHPPHIKAFLAHFRQAVPSLVKGMDELSPPFSCEP